MECMFCLNLLGVIRRMKHAEFVRRFYVFTPLATRRMLASAREDYDAAALVHSLCDVCCYNHFMLTRLVSRRRNFLGTSKWLPPLASLMLKSALQK